MSTVDSTAERVWLKQYPPGLPADIDPAEWASLTALMDDTCQRNANRIAFKCMDASMTFAEFDVQARAFAAWLQNNGFERGDRIAIMLPNLLQYPVAMLGTLRAGMVVVNVNPLYTHDELHHQLVDSGAKAIIVLENFAHIAQGALAGTAVEKVLVTGVGDMLGTLKGTVVNLALRHVKKAVPRWNIPGSLLFTRTLREGAGQRFTPVKNTHTDLAFLQYTGGTTGVSKGAMLSHGNMVANLLQCRSWFMQLQMTNPVYVIALPLYHIFSLTCNLLVFGSLGGTGIMIPNPRDFRGFVRELKRNPPQLFAGVNTLFNALMNTPGFAELDFSGLRSTMAGGMALQGAVAERWLKLTGVHITQGWGMTETSPVITICSLMPDQREFTGSVGLPLASTEVASFSDDGQKLPLNEVGELCARGPQVMSGYWQRPDETAKVMLPDGWLRTGDIGRVDERGYVFIEDRKKDMIIVSGFKVFPNEIEDVVARLKGVREVAAIAQPDPRSGETVVLFIVRDDPGLTRDVVRQYCSEKFTRYKQPSEVYFRDELPKTNVGKILRRQLRDELAASRS